MEPFDASAVRAAYDSAAKDYAETFGSDLLQLPLDLQLLEAFQERIGAGASVLDLGCGPGRVGHFLADRGHRVVGLDLSMEMLFVARQRFGNRLLACGDMRRIPFGSGSFSGVLAFYSVHNLARAEIGTALGEIHRVLNASGTFLVATHMGSGEVYTSEFLGHEIKPVGGTLYRADELLTALHSEGFVVEGVDYRKPLPHEHDTQRIYVSARRAGR